MTHWAEAYIGKPWVKGTSGPDSYDCWGLVQSIYASRYAITLPRVDLETYSPREVATVLACHSERARWRHVESPQEGDAVLMSHARDPSHVGLWIDVSPLGGVLHSVRGAGVLFSTRDALRKNRWGRLEFYRCL